MYKKPEVEILKLEIEEVISASGNPSGGQGNGQGGGVLFPDDPDGF